MSKRGPRKVLKPPGKCIFCGGGAVPGNPMSGEHLWSNWMAPLLPSWQGSEYIEFAETFMNNLPLGKRMERTRQGTSNTKRIKAVCQDCNNTWMSQLETAVKPILTPLILGEPRLLTLEERKTLSEWIALKILVAEHNSSSDSAADPIYDQPARDEFRLNKTIPSGFRIWIGIHNGEKWKAGIFRHTAGLIAPGGTIPPEPRSKNTQAVTFGLGSLLTHVFASTTPANEGIELQGMDAAFRPLWPLTETNIAWPPFYILSDADGDRVAAMLQNLMDSSIWIGE